MERETEKRIVKKDTGRDVKTRAPPALHPTEIFPTLERN